jgi:hypothetical protein
MDIEKFSSLELKTEDVKDITEVCNKCIDLEQQVNTAEENLSRLKEKLRDYQERIIPEMMQEAGVDSLVLTNGKKVNVKPFYGAKIPIERQDEAFSWLRSKGHGDMIKNSITANLDRGQDNLASELVKVCQQHGFNYSQKMKVEPMTLKAWARERVEKGEELPFDLFGIYIANRATIK